MRPGLVNVAGYREPSGLVDPSWPVLVSRYDPSWYPWYDPSWYPWSHHPGYTSLHARLGYQRVQWQCRRGKSWSWGSKSKLNFTPRRMNSV